MSRLPQGDVGLARDRGKPDRERSGNLRTRRRNWRTIGPLESSSVLMCDGRRNGQGGRRIQLSARDPGWKCPGPLSEVVAVARRKRRRNEAAGLGHIRPTVPLPMTGKPLLRCADGVPIREPVSRTLRPSLGEVCPNEPIRKPIRQRNERENMIKRPMHANDNLRPKEAA